MYNVPLDVRFWRKVDKTDDCWLWTGDTINTGYGIFVKHKRQGKRTMILAHRMSYELHIGSIPDGLTIDHLCRNRLCVNPEHLEPVSLQENIRRGGNSIKTHCPAGHPLSGVNLYIRPVTSPQAGGRQCKECDRIRQRKTNE